MFPSLQSTFPYVMSFYSQSNFVDAQTGGRQCSGRRVFTGLRQQSMLMRTRFWNLKIWVRITAQTSFKTIKTAKIQWSPLYQGDKSIATKYSNKSDLQLMSTTIHLTMVIRFLIVVEVIFNSGLFEYYKSTNNILYCVVVKDEHFKAKWPGFKSQLCYLKLLTWNKLFNYPVPPVSSSIKWVLWKLIGLEHETQCLTIWVICILLLPYFRLWCLFSYYFHVNLHCYYK